MKAEEVLQYVLTRVYGARNALGGSCTADVVPTPVEACLALKTAETHFLLEEVLASL